MDISPEQMDKINANPLYQTIGMRLISAENGRIVSQLTPPENVCWPFPGQPHGGILFTQMDSTMAWAALSKAEEGTNCGTINLEIQYPSPARDGVFTCETQVVHFTGRSCFVRGETRDKNGGLVAMGQGTFRIINVNPIL